jgi:hypothetical protein
MHAGYLFTRNGNGNGDISQLSQMMPFRLFRLLKVIDA